MNPRSVLVQGVGFGPKSILFQGFVLDSSAVITYTLGASTFRYVALALEAQPILSAALLGYSGQSLGVTLRAEYILGVSVFNYDATDIGQASSISENTPLVDAMSQKLLSLGYKGAINDMLFTFFGGTKGMSIHDAERLWLIVRVGVLGLSNQDMWNRYLISLGYSGSLPNMLMKFWIAY